MAQPNKTKIPVGYVLSGKYRVTREIGRGGMAAVYEAENIDIGKRVAIKVLAQELTSSAIVVERFLREARAAAAIRSPYICDVYDSGKLEDGRPFLVLELLEGESLYERMTKVRQLDIETTMLVVTQTCRGLTKAHAASIVHRDLKPENIFLTKDEEGRLLSKILDFGLAKFYAPMEGSGGEKQARLTREGAVFGTPAYMSPEQVRGQGAVDHRADLWALGCITYECLTGKTVWATEQGVAMTFAQIANSPLPKPTKLRPDLPLAFAEWFEKALDRDIEKRFQSAKEFAEELAAAFAQGPPSFSAITSIDMLGLVASLEEDTKRDHSDNSATNKVPGKEAPTGVPPPPAQSAPRVSAAKPESEPSEAAHPSGPTSARGSKVGFVAPLPSGADSSAGPARAPSRPSGGSGRLIVVLGAAVLVASGAYAGWRQFAQPAPPLATASATPVADAGPAPSATAAPPDAGVTPASMPWSPQISDAQLAITTGDYKTASKLLKDAFDKGGHGVPRTMLEQVQIASSPENLRALCKLNGIGRPRTYDLTPTAVRSVAAGRPSIATGPKGAVMVWTDSHDGTEHGYAALLDGAMRVAAGPYDVTPEGTAIGRPELTAVDGRFVLTYWDAKGAEAGVHVRWLDADGRIAGASIAVAPSKGGNFFPSLTRITDGSFYVAWTDDGDANSEDLFLRHLAATLEPMGDAVRATDIARTGGSKPRVRYPSLASWGDALHVAFRMERDPDRLIEHLRLPIADAGKGLGPVPKNGKLLDRFVGEAVLVNSDRAKADAPGIQCAGGACALVWHGESQGGAWAAYLDPAKTAPLWRKKFAKGGAHPALGMTTAGLAQLVWFESGRVVTATIGRDGVGPSTKIARITGEQPMPSVSPSGKPGEWYIAWLDYETGHLEPYAARVVCK